jgi:hypothetical protein
VQRQAVVQATAEACAAEAADNALTAADTLEAADAKVTRKR